MWIPTYPAGMYNRYSLAYWKEVVRIALEEDGLADG